LIRALEDSLHGEQFGNFRNRLGTWWEHRRNIENKINPNNPTLPKRKKTWAPWVHTASPHWLQEIVLPIVFFAIFGLGYW
jgi:hypothetical protein